ncbi:hypothetical protein BDY24DRAFT_414828 [Mrakia frigida]|uniref:uncharacterized protein n=1 Tax=Mrakia frigida TaxID=29902 RepID=UPI003FCBF18C
MPGPSFLSSSRSSSPPFPALSSPLAPSDSLEPVTEDSYFSWSNSESLGNLEDETELDEDEGEWLETHQAKKPRHEYVAQQYNFVPAALRRPTPRLLVSLLLKRVGISPLASPPTHSRSICHRSFPQQHRIPPPPRSFAAHAIAPRDIPPSIPLARLFETFYFPSFAAFTSRTIMHSFLQELDADGNKTGNVFWTEDLWRYFEANKDVGRMFEFVLQLDQRGERLA